MAACAAIDASMLLSEILNCELCIVAQLYITIHKLYMRYK